ncbi:MAG: carboxymuconolactone decarboxylase family protein [Acidimicrobiia bacterium]
MSGTRASRLAPIPVEQWGDDARDALRGWLHDGADMFLADGPGARRVPNVLGALMHHPRLAGPWLAYNDVLLNTPALDARLRELAILRVAWRARSDYEWLQHVRMARQVGITAQEVEAIAGVADTEPWTPLQSDLLAATDQLIDRFCIDDTTWARLAGQLDARQLVELVFVVGSYTCLAMAFNSFGLELDPDLDPGSAPAIPAPEE